MKRTERSKKKSGGGGGLNQGTSLRICVRGRYLTYISLLSVTKQRFFVMIMGMKQANCLGMDEVGDDAQAEHRHLS